MVKKKSKKKGQPKKQSSKPAPAGADSDSRPTKSTKPVAPERVVSSPETPHALVHALVPGNEDVNGVGVVLNRTENFYHLRWVGEDDEHMHSPPIPKDWVHEIIAPDDSSLIESILHCLAEDRFQDGFEMAQTAINENTSGDWRLWALQGQILFGSEGQYLINKQMALKSFVKALRLGGDTISSAQTRYLKTQIKTLSHLPGVSIKKVNPKVKRSSLLLKRAQELWASGKKQEAFEAATAATQADTANWRAWKVRGDVCYAFGDEINLAGAYCCFERALEENIDQAEKRILQDKMKDIRSQVSQDAINSTRAFLML